MRNLKVTKKYDNKDSPILKWLKIKPAYAPLRIRNSLFSSLDSKNNSDINDVFGDTEWKFTQKAKLKQTKKTILLRTAQNSPNRKSIDTSSGSSKHNLFDSLYKL